MKLNLGSGVRTIEGFKNVDIDCSANPDYCFDIEFENWTIEDNTIEEIRAHHILEHIGRGFDHVIKEMYRVCKHGAIIDIEVPHYLAFNFYHDYTHIRPITVEMFQQFSKKHNDKDHDKSNTTGHAYTLGVDFEIIGYHHEPSYFWAERFKSMSKEEIEFVAANYVNVFSVTKIGLAVNKEDQL